VERPNLIFVETEFIADLGLVPYCGHSLIEMTAHSPIWLGKHQPLKSLWIMSEIGVSIGVNFKRVTLSHRRAAVLAKPAARFAGVYQTVTDCSE